MFKDVCASGSMGTCPQELNERVCMCVSVSGFTGRTWVEVCLCTRGTCRTMAVQECVKWGVRTTQAKYACVLQVCVISTGVGRLSREGIQECEIGQAYVLDCVAMCA